MRTKSDIPTFEASRFITASRISAEGKDAFSPLPRWAAGAKRCFHSDGKISLELGEKYLLTRRLTFVGFGVMCELTRLGGSIVVNPNAAGDGGTPYVRLIYPHAPGDMVPVLRLMADAGPGEKVTTGSGSSELSAENVVRANDPNAKKAAREIAIRNARRQADLRAAAGTLPAGFDVTAWLANIVDLFAAIDHEALTGICVGGEEEEAGDGDPFEGEGFIVWEAHRGPLSDSGPILLSTFTPELLANLNDDVADFSPATRTSLKERLGVSDEFINKHIRGLFARWSASVGQRAA